MDARLRSSAQERLMRAADVMKLVMGKYQR
jgi:hypothetical protein